MTVREMEIDDLEAVYRIERQNSSMPWDKNGLLSFLIRDGSVFLVAEDNGRIIGFAGLVSVADESDLINISVAPDRRREGAAEMLLNGIISGAQKLDVKKIYLEVRISNEPAIMLYRKFGFTDIGIRKNYYEKPVEDAIVMEKDI